MPSFAFESLATDASPKAPPEAPIATSISSADQVNTFGSARSANAESIAARENSTFKSGSVDFGQTGDLYAQKSDSSKIPVESLGAGGGGGRGAAGGADGRGVLDGSATGNPCSADGRIGAGGEVNTAQRNQSETPLAGSGALDGGARGAPGSADGRIGASAEVNTTQQYQLEMPFAGSGAPGGSAGREMPNQPRTMADKQLAKENALAPDGYIDFGKLDGGGPPNNQGPKEYQGQLPLGFHPEGEGTMIEANRHYLNDAYLTKMQQPEWAQATDDQAREAILRQTTAEVCNNIGMVNPAVFVRPLPGFQGVYLPGHGVIGIDNERAQEGPEKLIGTQAHELDHLDQDTIKTRWAADQLGIGKEASNDQVNQIKQKLGNDQQNPAFIRTVLSEAAPLSPGQAERARKLVKDHAELGEEVASVAANEKILSNLASDCVQRMDGTKAAELVNRILTDPQDPTNNLLKQQPSIAELIATKAPDPGDLVTPTSFDSDDCTALQKSLDRAFDQQNKIVEADHDKYLKWPWEEEARRAEASVVQLGF